ncbi:ABC transporter substrate-binding protein [Kitasatospora xanthocidica]|uniref:extracellular solute-binding protein n=1 Tax=Kitasatospora xanthocidica TaxID=83382 RepID=UPI0016797774|nr:extracellular solute-binding protein [Kitasatospora xanthocidica]GHF88681.1 ABC transporter substrate-binding protein [Kitasatospora xanthocidica]
MRVRTAAVAAVAALSLSACAGGGTPAGSNSAAAPSGHELAVPTTPVTITFEEAMTIGTLKPAMDKLVADFQAKYPNITVKLQGDPDYATMYTKEKAEVQAGNAPTIGQVYESWASYFQSGGAITPISELAGTDTPPQLAGFYKGVQKDLALGDGKNWMWPFNKSVLILFYNADMLKAAGQSEPKTWDDYATAMKAVSTNGVTGSTIDPGTAAGAAFGTQWFEILTKADGGALYDADGTPHLNDAGAVKAMTYLKSLKDAHALATGKNYPGETALGALKGAFDISSAAGYGFEKKTVGDKLTLGISALPSGPQGAVNELTGTNMVVFKNATADQKAAAWAFMKFITGPEEQAGWAAASGYLPVTPQALPQMQDFIAQNPYETAAVSQLDTAFALPPYNWIFKCQGYEATAIQDVLDNGAAPADALKTAQDACATAKTQG